MSVFFAFLYGLATMGIVLIPIIVVVLAVWLIAFTGMFFTFIREGEGIVVVKGKRFHRPIIAFKGYHLEYDNNLHALRVTKGDEKKNPIKYFFEDVLGVYWVGFYPFYKIYTYEFRWKEWKTEADKYTLIIRDEFTSFFYVKTFRYASFLQAAEAMGNVPVDVKFSVFVCIVVPEIALFRAEDWFMQLDDYVLRKARIYVGEREFDALRTEASKGGTQAFSNYITALNEKISDDEPGVIERLGVEIVSAQIVEIDVAGTEEEKKKTLAATTERYRKEQEGAGIIAIGNARAAAMRAEGEAIRDLGEVGVMLRKQQALEQAGEGGNVVVFSEKEGGALTAEHLAGLVTAHIKKGADKEDKVKSGSEEEKE